MINRVRTLLLNRDSAQVGLGNFGFEYVPVGYRAVRLPSQLNGLIRLLFGSNPDLAGMNYRLRQFMPFLHAAEIVAYTLMDDTRITYDLNDERLFRETNTPQLFNVQTQVGVKYVIQPGALETDSGQLEYRCLCQAATDDSYGDTGDPANVLVMPPSWANGLSDPLLLPNSGGISVILMGASMPPGDSFNVRLIRRPKTNVAELAARLGNVLNEEVALALFGAGAPDRFAQFAAWYYDSQQLHFQLAGVLLALARRTDLLRQGG